MTPPPAPPTDAPISSARKWAITFSVMMVTVMQVLDTSITNVALPHMQGSLSASIDEMSWVITSYLAANAVIIPASGWLTAVFGRRRFFLICTVLFTASSFLSGIAPNLEFLVAMRIFQGLGGGPVIPMAAGHHVGDLPARGSAAPRMAVWGVGIMMAPILGPTVGGWIADNWSWRWIFYINLPIGVLGFFMVERVPLRPAVPAQAAARRRARHRADGGAASAACSSSSTVGEREDWFDSTLIVTSACWPSCALVRLRDPGADGRGADPRPQRCSPTGTSRIGGIAIFLDRARHSTRAWCCSRSTRRRCSGYDALDLGPRAGAGGRRQR